jgi:predicted acylesterase/phospholipase RssA
VWQAARATSAAPTFFDPLEIENIATLRDGGLLNNNPINEVIPEIQTEFDDRGISCLVSIGTGVSKTESFGYGLISIAKACKNIATDTEKAELTFRNSYAASPKQSLHDRYFRFEVEQGLQDIGMEEWKKMKQIWTATTSYLDDQIQADKLRKCSIKLRRPETISEIGVGGAI